MKIALVVHKQWLRTREGVIIECPQNDFLHDRRYVIITSRMAFSQISLTVAVNMMTWNPPLTDNHYLVEEIMVKITMAVNEKLP